jgi:hypothetical protein
MVHCLGRTLGFRPRTVVSKSELFPSSVLGAQRFCVFCCREFDITAAEVGGSVLTLTSEDADQEKHHQQNKNNISRSSSSSWRIRLKSAENEMLSLRSSLNLHFNKASTTNSQKITSLSKQK